MKIPAWVKFLIWALEMLPGFPIWLKALIPSLEALVEELPLGQQQAAAESLPAAVKAASDRQSHEPIQDWLDKQCNGVGCPPTLK